MGILLVITILLILTGIGSYFMLLKFPTNSEEIPHNLSLSKFAHKDNDKPQA